MIRVSSSGETGWLPTAFLPAERALQDDVWRQHEMLAALPFVREFLDAMPSMAVVLNSQRQIVFANRSFAEFIGTVGRTDDDVSQRHDAFEAVLASVLGRRTGEALGCLHASESDGGCGTTPFCRECGAANALLNSQRWHTLDVQECRLICGDVGAREMALDFRVWAQPIVISGETFTTFSMMDISHEKRREALERIFFHDVLNTASGVKGLADLMIMTNLPESAIRDAAGMMANSAEQLIEEINAQRALNAAESGDLKVSAEPVHSMLMVERVMQGFHSYCLNRNTTVRAHDDIEAFELVSDPVLLRRVLVNLVKNALEAEPAGGVVTIGARAQGDHVLFTVHNPKVMPNDVQMQVFQRSFSTKGSGRGLGTYSIKLLTERYLGGRAWFVSNDDDGTTFTIRLPRDIARLAT